MIDLQKHVFENWTWNPWTAFKRWMGTADVESLKRELEVAQAGFESIRQDAIELREQLQASRERERRYKNTLSDIAMSCEMTIQGTISNEELAA